MVLPVRRQLKRRDPEMTHSRNKKKENFSPPKNPNNYPITTLSKTSTSLFASLTNLHHPVPRHCIQCHLWPIPWFEPSITDLSSSWPIPHRLTSLAELVSDIYPFRDGVGLGLGHSLAPLWLWRRDPLEPFAQEGPFGASEPGHHDVRTG